MVKDLKKISEKVTMEPQIENEFIFFGRSVAAQLMSLTPISAIKAQERIQSILTSFKIEDFEKSDNRSHPPYIQSYAPTPSTSSSLPLQSPVYAASPMQSPGYTNSTLQQTEYNYVPQDTGVSSKNILNEAFFTI